MSAETSSVWVVICEHNRHGEYIAGIYSNRPAATAHKEYLDARVDGWENLRGGEICETQVCADFIQPTDARTK